MLKTIFGEKYIVAGRKDMQEVGIRLELWLQCVFHQCWAICCNIMNSSQSQVRTNVTLETPLEPFHVCARTLETLQKPMCVFLLWKPLGVWVLTLETFLCVFTLETPWKCVCMEHKIFFCWIVFVLFQCHLNLTFFLSHMRQKGWLTAVCKLDARMKGVYAMIKICWHLSLLYVFQNFLECVNGW
jgi:hypothetical protein